MHPGRLHDRRDNLPRGLVRRRNAGHRDLPVTRLTRDLPVTGLTGDLAVLLLRLARGHPADADRRLLDGGRTPLPGARLLARRPEGRLLPVPGLPRLELPGCGVGW